MPDVVVVGAGIAGLVAGNRAAELGATVLVLEAGQGAYMCNTRIATGALNFAHSNPEQPVDELVEAVDADTEGHGDPVLARTWAGTAARGLQWLRDNGAEIERKQLQGKTSWMLSPPRSLVPGLDWESRGADRLLHQLAARLGARGGELRTGTRATTLVQAPVQEGRRVRGVSVTNADGTGEHIEARCVILADGGFQGDPGLVRRFICSKPEALVQRSAGTGRGDGIRMAEQAGAQLVETEQFYGHLLSRDALANPQLWPYPTLDSLTNGSILVGADGRRMFDEGSGGILLSNLLARHADPLGAWIVFDEEIWTTTGFDEVVPANPHLVEAGGTLLTAGTIGELAELMGLPPAALADTVATYNAATRDGTTDRLHPPRSPGRRFGIIRNAPVRIPVRPVERAPFYAAPLAVGLSCTIGGVRIDAGSRVLDRDGRAIPGLYAAGSTTGGLEGGPASGYIGGLAKAYCTALLAAEASVDALAAERTASA